MTIKVECTSCGKVLTAKDSAAGKRAKCPQCGDIIQIPEVYEAEEVGGDYADDEYGDDGYDDDYDDSPDQEKRKPCPACGEMIIRGAAKCRFCGEIFDPALKRKAKKNKEGRWKKMKVAPRMKKKRERVRVTTTGKAIKKPRTQRMWQKKRQKNKKY